MKKIAVLIGLTALAGIATAQSVGIEVGKVLAVDREAKLMVLTDRSAWSLALVRNGMSDELAAGDRVQFSYKTPEEGPPTVIEIDISRHASDTVGTEVAEGTVLAYDRRAELLLLADKSVWPLARLDPGPPPGLGAGDRVRIEYRSGEDGSIDVQDLIVTFN
jgi:hypothetical protein